MKKNIISFILVLAMALSLAACGSAGTPGSTDAPADKTQNGQNQEHPEFVYTAKFDELITGSKNYISPRLYAGDGYYATAWEKVGENNPEGKIPQYEGEFDVYQSMLYFLSNDGKLSKLEKYEPIPMPENENGYADFRSGSYMDGLLLGRDGKLITVDSIYSSWYEGDKNLSQSNDEYWQYVKYEQKYFLRTLDRDGAELSRVELEVGDAGYLNTYNMKADRDNNILVIAEDVIRAIAPDGSDAYVIDCGGYVDSLFELGDGRIAISTYGDNGQEIAVIDPETHTLGERTPVNIDIYNSMPGNGEYDLFYTNGTNFYGYVLAENRKDKIFNWLSCDINGDSVMQLHTEEDGSIVGFMTEWNEKDETSDLTRVTVSKQPYDSVPHKETITMAAVNLDYDVVNKIVEFNRKNDKYRIEVSDYSEYNSEENGWDAGTTKLNTEIMAGNIPDMFSLNGLNYKQLASKGILADLYPFIDADSELRREDFFENVLQAVEVDGKLCATVPGFYINAVVGAASVVGDTPGWTYAQLQDALASMPAGCTAFDQYMTKADILRNCLALDMDSFVDWSNGKCSFDSEQFIELLKFVNTFPDEYDWNNMEYSDESTYDRISQGKQLLMQTSIYNIESIAYDGNEQYFGGEVTYIGYPTMNGTGNMIGFTSSGIAMSEKSPYKDEIWKFLREFFTEEYQEVSWALPISRSVFEKALKEACTVQYRKNSEGQYMLDENGEKIPVVRYSIWDEETQQSIDYYCLTEEQAERLRTLVTTTNKVSNYDDSIYSIVNEQAQAYFAGQRTAEDVAKLIQSKANIFVNEQK